MPERGHQAGDLRLARRALIDVLPFFQSGVTDEIHGYSLIG
jgi:hypothetical protein